LLKKVFLALGAICGLFICPGCLQVEVGGQVTTEMASAWFLDAPGALNAYMIYSLDEEEATDENDREEERVAYLTFDDGPSEHTVKVLDILKEYDVKATFFVNGNDTAFGRNMYRRMVKEGHALGNHTYSHTYSQIYSSVDSFFEDFLKLEKLLKKTTGVRPRIMRFPGGSTNTVSRSVSGYQIMDELVAKVEKEEYIYHDWNVCAFDSDYPPPNSATIAQNVLQQASFKEGDIVVLLHDGMMNKTTPGALPRIIEGLRELGFQFRVLTPEVEKVQFY